MKSSPRRQHTAPTRQGPLKLQAVLLLIGVVLGGTMLVPAMAQAQDDRETTTTVPTTAPPTTAPPTTRPPATAAPATAPPATAPTSTAAPTSEAPTTTIGEPKVLYVEGIPDDDPDGGLVVRSGPGTTFDRLDVLPNGTEVVSTGWPLDGDWLPITEPELGWVIARRLSETPPPAEPTATSAPQTEAPTESAESSGGLPIVPIAAGLAAAGLVAGGVLYLRRRREAEPGPAGPAALIDSGPVPSPTDAPPSAAAICPLCKGTHSGSKCGGGRPPDPTQ